VFGRVVGSVLAFNGLQGFLSNTREEVREHSTKHQQLVALAERLIDSRPKGFVWEIDSGIQSADDDFKRRSPPEAPMEQKDWVPYLVSAGVIPAACDTPQKQKKAATHYMNGVVKVPVEVDISDRTVRAMLVSRPLRSRRTAYVLAVEGLPVEASADGDGRPAEAPAVILQPVTPTPTPTPADTQADEQGQGDELWDD